jgi:hypothetical protein
MKNFTKFTYHLQFEAQYDEVPVIRVYENYLDFDGELHTDFEQIVDRYEFTNDDVEFTLAILGIESIEDLWIDEYFSVEAYAKQKWIHPIVTEWVEQHYEVAIRELLKEIV